MSVGELPLSPDSATLKPCPLCQSTDIQIGVCYVDGSSTREDAARCGNCGCRATKRAWQSRGFAQCRQEPEGIQWRRVNEEPFEYAIQQDRYGDKFVNLANGTCLRRALSDTSPRTPKVRTSHHRNKEEAARLQKLVDKRLAVSDTSTDGNCPRCKREPADKALLGADDEGHICGTCWSNDRHADSSPVGESK